MQHGSTPPAGGRLGALRALLPYLRRYRRPLLLGLGCSLAANALGLLPPLVVREAIDRLTGPPGTAWLAAAAWLVIGLVAVEGGFRYLMRRTIVWMSRRVEYALRHDVFRHLHRLSPSYYQEASIGDLVSRLTNDLAAVQLLLGMGLLSLGNTVFTTVVGVSLMVHLSPKLTLLALVPFPLLALAVNRLGRRIYERYQAVQQQYGRLSQRVQETLSGIREIKAFAREDQEDRRFAACHIEYLRRNLALIRVQGLLIPLVGFLSGLGAVLILAFGGRMVMRGEITLGTFVAFNAYLALLVWPAMAVGWVANLLHRAAAALVRLQEIFREAPQVQDRRDALPIKALRGAVAFRHLTFRYHPRGEPVLRDIHLEIPRSALVGIVGPTGSGKSTLVKLLLRLYPVPDGTIFIDGVDINRIPLALLRRDIAYVSQEAFLFSESVRDNIAFGVDSLSEAELLAVADLVQIRGEVEAFPQGFDTRVGERGIALSGGQRQRTALARALAKRAALLILDDGFSNVDADTEARILQGLRERLRQQTTLLISHRVSTVQHADRILVLQDGAIVEQGTHLELLERGGVYRELYGRQLLEKELEELP